jgi:hypothetical protein
VDHVNASCKFIDSEGFAWQVYEVSRADQVASVEDTSSGWLYFFSRDITRVLSSYPVDWFELDWPDLEALCRSAAQPRARSRTRTRQTAAAVAGDLPEASS